MSLHVSRRRWLRAAGTAASVGLLGSLSGCGDLQSDSETTETPSTLDESGPDVVPAGSEFVLTLDVETLLGSATVESEADARLSTIDRLPPTLSATLDIAQGAVGLDPREVSSATVFGTDDSDDDLGAVFRTDWTADDVRSSLEDANAAGETDTYGGVTVVEVENSGLDATPLAATFDGGTVLVGGDGAVEAVIDIASGEGEAVGGAVATAYEQSSAGPFRFGSAVLADQSSSGGSGIYDSVTHTYGALDGAGSDATFSVTMVTGSGSAASEVRTRVETQLEVAESGAFATSERMRSEVTDLLSDTTVTADGDAVVVANENGVEAFVTLGGAIGGSFVLGLGGQRNPPPQVQFSFEYDERDEIVSITHHGGDTIRRSELSVRGSGFQQVGGADQSSPGRWQGTAGGEISGQPAIYAGDSVTVGVSSDAEIQVVWQEDNQSAVLASWEGPDA